jgi:hypothetical protein
MDPFTLGDRIDPLGLANHSRVNDVDAGWMRAVRRGRITVDEALAAGLSRMLDEDDAERRQRDPLAYVAARKDASLRTLLGRLFRR